MHRRHHCGSCRRCDIGPLKSRANALMKAGKFLEAIMQYSNGITMQPQDPLLYCNRSLAFLKMAQHFYALKDAEAAIRLLPDWAKGYYRKGQAELSAEMFKTAIATFEQGLKYCPCDELLQKSLVEAKQKYQAYLDWMVSIKRRYTLLGLFFGLMIIVIDVWKPKRSFLKYGFARFIVFSICSILGYCVAALVISVHRSSKSSLLQPPSQCGGGVGCYVPNVPCTSPLNPNCWLPQSSNCVPYPPDCLPDCVPYSRPNCYPTPGYCPPMNCFQPPVCYPTCGVPAPAAGVPPLHSYSRDSFDLSSQSMMSKSC